MDDDPWKGAHGDTEIVAVLLQQHRHMLSLLAAVGMGPPLTRPSTFAALGDLLIRHELAEAEIVLPIAQMIGLPGAGSSDAWLGDQHALRRCHALLQRIDPTSSRFLQHFLAFRVDLEDHLDAEERDVFPMLIDRISENRRRELGETLVVAELLADADGLASCLWRFDRDG